MIKHTCMIWEKYDQLFTTLYFTNSNPNPLLTLIYFSFFSSQKLKATFFASARTFTSTSHAFMPNRVISNVCKRALEHSLQVFFRYI